MDVPALNRQCTIPVKAFAPVLTWYVAQLTKGVMFTNLLANGPFCSSSASPSCVTYARASKLDLSDVQYSYACEKVGGSVSASISPTAGKAPGKRK
jgi:hypothetical protein